RAGHRPEMIERPGERHHPRPAHAPVGRLEPDDAAARSGETDGAAGVGPDGAERQPGGDRRARAARGATRRVSRTPRVLDVTVVRVVAECAERQLDHVELAEADGTRAPKTAHGFALALVDEVLLGLRAARRR